MNINETTNFNSQIIIEVADTTGATSPSKVQVGYLTATLDTANQNFNISLNVSNKDLFLANAEEVKKQYAAFEAEVKARAIQFGYVIF